MQGILSSHPKPYPYPHYRSSRPSCNKPTSKIHRYIAVLMKTQIERRKDNSAGSQDNYA
ncbi:hypothetical protein Hanom_Chr05g00473041 [Helianthus anomalus]